MDHTKEISELAQQQHIEVIAQEEEAGGCCGGSCGCSSEAETEAYMPQQDLGLGSGLPAEFIQIKEGDVVVDLGAGIGNNSFHARELVGIAGKVIGVEMNETLVERARQNAEAAGFNNVEFRSGHVEDAPVSDESAKAVISSNLLSNTVHKEQLISEAYRIVKHHGNVSFSDIVTDGNMPEGLRIDGEMYLGCAGGSLSADAFLKTMVDGGFEEVRIADMKPIGLPEAMLFYYLKDEEIMQYRRGDFGFYQMTVVAEKPCCKSGKSEEEVAVMESDHSACACGGEHCGN